MTVREIQHAIKRIAARRRIPSATYRWQLNSTFDFRKAAALVNYLDDLGISDCYISPFFQARAGSTHGYDVCDFTRINPALGGAAGLRRLCAALKKRRMGLVADMAPNHMGIADPANRWWMDVLELGPRSRFASYFDIDWAPSNSKFKNKVVLPVLGESYADALKNSHLSISYAAGSFFICYHEKRFPISARTYAFILQKILIRLRGVGIGERTTTRRLSEIHERLVRFAAQNLPIQADLFIAEIKREIDALLRRSAVFRQATDAVVKSLNQTENGSLRFKRLNEILGRQNYSLVFWVDGFRQINYRRFFDVSELAALRMEKPEVFQACHRLLLELLIKGQVTGLRIDHPDGLRDPEEYFLRLQTAYLAGAIAAQSGTSAQPEILVRIASQWTQARKSHFDSNPRGWPLFVMGEKILSRSETLPTTWAISGTTGYDFLNAVNGLFVDRRSAEAFDRLYANFVPQRRTFDEIVAESKRRVLQTLLAADLNFLARQLKLIASKDRRFRHYTKSNLRAALVELLAAFAVYRTYFKGDRGVAAHLQKKLLDQALHKAQSRNPKLAPRLLKFIRGLFLGDSDRNFGAHWDHAPEHGTSLRVQSNARRFEGKFMVRPSRFECEIDKIRIENFIARLQQFMPAVVGKGYEDTALYIYNRLVPLNEVGGRPDQFGTSVAAFHRHNKQRAELWPNSFSATSTHDTKRGEDARARLNVLSEMPNEWRDALTRWSRLNASKKNVLNGRPAPDANDEYLLYQTLIAAWTPDNDNARGFEEFRERICAYLLKAVREAKVHTSWHDPNREYECAVENFARQLIEPRATNLFWADFSKFQRRVAHYGYFNSLSQVLLKIASPGVPDFYQGTELWDLSLVDPDNRRPINFQARRRVLAELKERIAKTRGRPSPLFNWLLKTTSTGRIKFYLIYKALHYRRDHHELFADGDYFGLSAKGSKRNHVCGFARTLRGETAVAVVPRLAFGLIGPQERYPLGEEIWGDTCLVLSPKDRGCTYRNVLTGDTLLVNDQSGPPRLMLKHVLKSFPVALLERKRG